MKKFFLVSGIILSFLFNNSPAQNFFPLNIGNEYQIKNDWDERGPGGYHDFGTYFNITTVLKDSAINGEIFYDINNEGDYNPFRADFLFRYDSLVQRLYIKIPGDDTVRLAADFNTPADSHYVSFIVGQPREFIASGLTYQIVMGDSQLVYKMETPYNSIFRYSYYFADKIGIFYFKFVDNQNPPFTGYFSEYNAISAILDSNFMNPLVLKIDSLYPVIDRPIDTFPFLLSIPYHVSYYQLISSFYLSLEVERDSSVIYNHDYNISVSNPHLQINPADLQVGDYIKLKVTISDTSIYKNIDYYPDTGWVIIHVLPPILGTETEEIAYHYKLEQNYPNPFNPSTLIRYEIPRRTFVSLKIYDILGNEVAILTNEEKPAGLYEVMFNGRELSSGVYIYKLQTPEIVQTNKMILAK